MTQTMTAPQTRLTFTRLGHNAPNKRKPIGVITFNKVTGQVAQCEVFSTFWEQDTPSTDELIMHLVNQGHGLIRFNTVKYASLV